MQSKLKNTYEIPVLNGFRVLFILLVAHFHIWQQSWLQPNINLFGQQYSLDYVARAGYVFVDGMVLLSALLMFLPYARHIFYGSELPNLKTYYIKRFARIAPSYYFSVFFILFAFVIPQKRYLGYEHILAKDLIYHIFFIHTFNVHTYIGTKLNVVLWTVAILVQGYIIMPFIIKALIKKPIPVSIAMLAIAFSFRYFAMPRNDIGMFLNQLPAFFDVYLYGFALSYVFVYLEKNNIENNLQLWHRAIFTVMFILSIVAISKLLHYQASSTIETLSINQLKTRFFFATAFSLYILFASMSFKFIIWIFSNKFIRFLSEISYNMYIWHQFLAVEMRMAFLNTEQLHADIGLQKAYTLLCWSVALIVAALCTYFIEKPCANAIKNKFLRSKE